MSAGVFLVTMADIALMGHMDIPVFAGMVFEEIIVKRVNLWIKCHRSLAYAMKVV